MEESILFVHPRNDYTGSTRVLSNIIASEYSETIITIICHKTESGFLSELPNVKLITYNEFRLFRRTIPFISDLLTRFKVFFLVIANCFNYDIVYVNTIVPYSAALASRLLGKRTIYHIHEKFISKSINYRIMEYVFNHVNAHRIFVSEYTRKKYPVNPKCTSEVKYNRLPPSFLRKVSIRPIKERKRNSVLMIASLSLAKGVDVFIKIAQQLPYLKFTLILSTQQSSIDEFFKEFDVPTNCTILPSQSDIHTFLYNSDLILCLTNPLFAVETFGMTILEAMPYGIPAVVPNVGGPIELVSNAFNGYCVDVTSPSVVAEYVAKSLEECNYEILCKNTLNRFRVLNRLNK